MEVVFVVAAECTYYYYYYYYWEHYNLHFVMRNADEEVVEIVDVDVVSFDGQDDCFDLERYSHSHQLQQEHGLLQWDCYSELLGHSCDRYRYYFHFHSHPHVHLNLRNGMVLMHLMMALFIFLDHIQG